MNSGFLLNLWNSITPSLADHLWQSTLFAAAAGLLTLMLRKNHAGIRYCLWLAASVKFLIPFSWLVALGGRLAWLRGSDESNSGLYYTIEQVSQPFTKQTSPVGTAGVTVSFTHVLPIVLAAIWLFGFLTVILVWCVRWRRIAAAAQVSESVVTGREVEALRRAERVVDVAQRVDMRISRSTLEPGIFGLRRPVLLWPEKISEHLTDEHLEAIIAHELWHVRRRDNLAASLHMIVEAIFWFHPLVWWLGARLVDERERACDEQVLELGSRRRTYAESILKVCEFSVSSPLPCVSGVTGSDLKKRMVHIMSEHVVRKLNFGKKLVLSAAGLLAILAPILIGLSTVTPSRAASQPAGVDTSTQTFQSVTITPSQPSARPTSSGAEKHMVRMMYGPGEFVADNVSIKSLIQEAYGVQANQIEGGPDWLDNDLFDVNAKVSTSASTKFGLGPNRDASQKMLQNVLADRTKLMLHRETKDLPTYDLVIADGGSKLRPSAEQGTTLDNKGPLYNQMYKTRGMQMQVGAENKARGLNAMGISTADLASQLSRQLGTPVVDKTGLKGNYDFALNWTESPNQASLLTAVQQQLGLKLDPQQGPTEVLVIDHIEKPSAE
jgi:uncharacterized protein (TIGR03435 family)